MPLGHTRHTMARSHADFQRGEADGGRLARTGSPLPTLHGGAYAVGLLFGYRTARRMPSTPPSADPLHA